MDNWELSLPMPPGIRRDSIRSRYDVGSFHEDEWHEQCGKRTRAIIDSELALPGARPNLLLNAGCGVYSLAKVGWREIGVDLFEAPLGARKDAVCANIESLPFDKNTFGAVVCVGEVLGYCDPQQALAEFSRVASVGATLICDFGSTQSGRYLFTNVSNRTADLVTDEYNGTEERIWVYHPDFIRRIIAQAGFRILKQFGTHSLSAIGCRIGLHPATASRLVGASKRMTGPKRFADVQTIVAERCEV